MSDLCWYSSCRNHSVLASIPCRPCRDRARRVVPKVPQLPKRVMATVDAGFQDRLRELNSAVSIPRSAVSIPRGDIRSALSEGRRLQDSLLPRIKGMWR